MACGTDPGCDAALRPRGRARRPTRGAAGADTWQEATQTGPRERPCGAPRGRRVRKLRAHGLVGPREFIGAVTQMRTAPPKFNRVFLLYFLRVGLCSHTAYLCRTRGRTTSVGFGLPTIARHRSRGLESTRSDLQHVREIEVK